MNNMNEYYTLHIQSGHSNVSVYKFLVKKTSRFDLTGYRKLVIKITVGSCFFDDWLVSKEKAN